MIKSLDRYCRRLCFLVFHNQDSRVVFQLPTLTSILQRHIRFIDCFLSGPYEDWLVQRLKRRYEKICTRLRRKVSSGKKITVMFVVSCPQKWKCQKLYDLLKEDSCFDPVIGLGEIALPGDITVSQACARYADMRLFFERRGCKCIQLFNPALWRNRKIHAGEADIVFLPEPWYDTPQHTITNIGKFALTAYVQYFIPTGIAPFYYQLSFHRELFRHFVINEWFRQAYLSGNEDKNIALAGEIVASGNPILDSIGGIAEAAPNENLVIYAPHWTVNRVGAPETDLKLSTFLEVGAFMLDYARTHREVTWVFKPHPALHNRLLELDIMNLDEIDAYYRAWKDIGELHEVGDYVSLFGRSRVMVTDCDSFLNEYGATGRPIIHLISPKDKRDHPANLKAVHDTYYKAHNIEELKVMLERIVVHREDPNKTTRLAALASSGLLGQNASQNICNHLKTILEVK